MQGAKTPPHQPLLCVCVSPPASRGQPSHGSYSRLTSTARSVSRSATSALVFPAEEKRWGSPAEPRGRSGDLPSRGRPGCWLDRSASSAPSSRSATWGRRKEQRSCIPSPTAHRSRRPACVLGNGKFVPTPRPGTGPRFPRGWGSASPHPARGPLLVNGLEELPLMLPDFGVVDLLQQLGVLIDEPRFPQDVGCSVLDLQEEESRRRVTGPGCAGLHGISRRRRPSSAVSPPLGSRCCEST